jgi:branched-chain amino acid transport system ATP-binding protein
MILEIRALTKAFGGLTAVNGISLDVKEGDLHAVIGPNGAGKSTFFNLISRYLPADSGKVIFKGKDITKTPPHEICKMGIAKSFQRVNIYPTLTVFESVQMSVLAQRGKALSFFRPASSMFEQETFEIIAQVGLRDQVNVPGDSLSHGDKKRLEVAIALGNEPALLLLDEPTAGMSAEETAATMEIVKRLAEQRGLTVMFTEHDMSVVFDIAKRITVLHQGSVIADGSLEEVRANEQAQKIYLGEA